MIQLSLLNSIANWHRTASSWFAAGGLFSVRAVISLSYVWLVVGVNRPRYHPARRACIGSRPNLHSLVARSTRRCGGGLGGVLGDHAAGDAVAGVAGGVGDLVVRLGVDHHRGAALLEGGIRLAL